MLQNNETQTQSVDNVGLMATIQETKAPALFSGFNSPYLDIKGAFDRQGVGEIPAEMTTSCTVYNGQLKFGEDLKHSFGDFVTVEVLNLAEYEKVDLGVNPVPAEAQKFVVTCKNGTTVIFEDADYPKEVFLEMLKKSGFPQAKFKLRAVLHAFFVGSEKNADKLDQDRLLAIYLSPSSLSSWNSFVKAAAIRRNPVTESPSEGGLVVKITTEEKSWDAKNITWTQMKFTSEKNPVTVQ